MTPDEAKEIYRTYFWEAHSLQLIPYPLNVMAFDQVVNRGFGGIRSLQATINKVSLSNLPIDGIMGPMTVNKINELLSKDALHDYIVLENYICECQLAYASIVKNDPSQAAFIKGWLARTHSYFNLFNNVKD